MMSGRESSKKINEGDFTQSSAEKISETEKNQSSSECKLSSEVKRGSENVSDRSSPSQPIPLKASLPPARTSPSTSPISFAEVTKNNSNTMSNRPPSTTSIHSNNSGGGPRTTATSRRGGRTRSRSPPAMRASMSSGSASPHFLPGGSSDNVVVGSVDTNPSSAAAAAAAAAKALSNKGTSSNPGGQGAWPDHHRHRGEDSYQHHRDDRGYDGHFQASLSRRWPVEQDPRDRPRRSGSYGHSQSIHRLPPGESGSGDLYGRHGPSGSYGSDNPFRMVGRSGSVHPSYDEQTEDRRYKTGRSMSPTTDRYGQPFYGNSRGGSSGGIAPTEGRASPKNRVSGSQSGNVMSRVIGTATPIHVPRAAEPPACRHSRSGTPASVFRGRPGIDGPRREGTDDDSPQKILLSLRTPTTSFDEKQPAKANTDSDLPPSPDEPPQIQNSHHQHGSDFFEPSRSPRPGSIEMAPSFNLFNQSFDSFGDTFNVVGNLEASLQSASFGAGPSASGDFGSGSSAQALQRSLSGGNYTQQLLGSSGSGALTFGMSPVNSFGNGPPAPSSTGRGSNMMVLGGQDHRAASPTQVLGMYHSYSGGASHGVLRSSNNMGPLEDSHLRLSASSFGGGPSLSQNYTRSFGAESMSYAGRIALSQDGCEGGHLFYVFLRKHKAAFKECMFLLPGLKAALLEAPLAAAKSGDVADGIDPVMKPSLSRGGIYPEPSPKDVAVALRRVNSAVCAFGGSQYSSEQSHHTPTSGQSIFREKEETPTVTPSSSTNSPPGTRNQSRVKAKYEEVLPTRYYENENRLSWEFEENPPVETPAVQDDSRKGGGDNEPEEKASCEASQGPNGEKEEKRTDAENSSTPPTPSTPSNSAGDNGDEASKADSVTSPSCSGDQPKMRYRCKLCGQPKQNHTCPFMQSLARSIGIMVYPAVNAFTAAEPGVVAPPLSEMNNFVGPDDGSVADSKASIPSPERRHLTRPGQNGSTQVTPESRRSKAGQLHSPTSTLSTGSSTPQRPPGSAGRSVTGFTSRTPGSNSSRRSRKRQHGQMHGSPSDGDQGDLLFVEPMELKPEQFRMITPSKVSSSPDAFTYPALPLPYAQRKRLSDNLFSLSQKIPQLTKECSAVLREAREKDMWDLAVAELMTQVVVVIHCHDGDACFDGLRQYLLTLGIAC